MSYVPVYRPGHATVTYGYIGETPYSQTQQTEGTWEQRPIATGGHHELRYLNVLKIDFIDPAAPSGSSDTVRVLWTGEAQMTSVSPAIQETAPRLIDRILDRLPTRRT